MRIESIFSTSCLIGAGPYGKTEVHRKEVDQQGRTYNTVETHPFFSYSAHGTIEAVKEVGKNVDKLA
jgi:hypothetical protein